MTMPKWRKLERWSRPIAGQPTVGFQSSGSLSFNYAAVEAMGEPELIDILFDTEEQLVGFRAAKSAAGSYPLNKQSTSSTYLASGKALAQTMKIPLGEARRWNATMVDGVLTIDLKEPGIKSTRGVSVVENVS